VVRREPGLGRPAGWHGEPGPAESPDAAKHGRAVRGRARVAAGGERDRLGLNWSAPGRVFDLRSRADRARVYEIVLQEGRPADIYVLGRRFGKEVLLTRAGQIDAGFDVRVLADMIATLDRFTDSEIPVPDGSSAAELREFYATAPTTGPAASSAKTPRSHAVTRFPAPTGLDQP
jgi:hypothetical protein